MPALTLVVPVKVLVPVSSSVPAPALDNPKPPLIWLLAVKMVAASVTVHVWPAPRATLLEMVWLPEPVATVTPLPAVLPLAEPA